MGSSAGGELVWKARKGRSGKPPKSLLPGLYLGMVEDVRLCEEGVCPKIGREIEEYQFPCKEMNESKRDAPRCSADDSFADTWATATGATLRCPARRIADMTSALRVSRWPWDVGCNIIDDTDEPSRFP